MPIKPQQHLRIGLFLTASLLAHTLLLLQDRSMDITLGSQAEQQAGHVLQVSLQHDTAPRPIVTQTMEAEAAAPVEPAVQPLRESDHQAIPPVRHVTANSAADTPATPGLETRARVLSRVRENLDRHFYYPVLARRHGWQGQVLLGFSVAADGMIGDVHVQRGSGHAILDESALAAMMRIKQLHQIQNWLQGHSLNLQLSVVYRLQGG